VGTKVIWYFITCAEVLQMRTSDWKRALTPATLATAGMISASGGGVFLAADTYGATRLTETCVVVVFLSSAPSAPPAELLRATLPVVVPGGRPGVCATTLRISPPAGTLPLDGATVSHGTVGAAMKLRPASSAGMVSGYSMSAGSLSMVEPSLPFSGRTYSTAAAENGPLPGGTHFASTACTRT